MYTHVSKCKNDKIKGERKKMINSSSSFLISFYIGSIRLGFMSSLIIPWSGTHSFHIAKCTMVTHHLPLTPPQNGKQNINYSIIGMQGRD
jgi:hypothetical protein